MPKAQQDYYYSYARQNFVNFADEDDPERVNFLFEVSLARCSSLGEEERDTERDRQTET